MPTTRATLPRPRERTKCSSGCCVRGLPNVTIQSRTLVDDPEVTVVDWDPRFDSDYDSWRDEQVRVSRIIAVIAAMVALSLGFLIGRSIA